jgi:replicative DNA helicase
MNLQVESLENIARKNGTNGTNGNGHNGNLATIPPTIPDKLQPNSVEAERAVLGGLFVKKDAIVEISLLLDPGDFFVQRHGWVYAVIKDLYNQPDQTPADTMTVGDELERRGQLEEIGGWAYLSELNQWTPDSMNTVYYAKIVKRHSGLRKLINAAGDISRLAYSNPKDDLIDIFSQAEETIFLVTSTSVTKKEVVPVSASVSDYLDKMEYLRQHKDALVGIPTGFVDLDRLLGGLQRSDMITLAGRPGMGKTSMALNVAMHAAKSQKRVAIFSLEMNHEQLSQRLISAEAGIDSQRLRLGDIREDEWADFVQASDSLSKLPIYFDDTPAISAMELRSKARRLQATHGLDLLIVDYLQLMRGDGRGENRTQEVSFISQSIKVLARELNIPVLALSQLSRACESRHDKRPILSDLRESGSIEQDSDVVIFIYRDDVYNPDTEFPNVAEVIVSKHRSGPTGVFSLYFKKRLTQFVGLEVRCHEFEQMPEGAYKDD